MQYILAQLDLFYLNVHKPMPYSIKEVLFSKLKNNIFK